MKPRVTDGLDGRSLFDVGYLGVFLEIFSSLPGLATMFPFFSPDRQTMSSSSFLPFFLGGSFAGRNGKSQKIDESAFYINIFKEISFLGFTRWQAIMRYAFKCGTKMNSRLNFCRERKRERDVCARTRVPLMKLHLINCLCRDVAQKRDEAVEVAGGHRKERCKSVSRESRVLLNVVPRGQLSTPLFHRFVSWNFPATLEPLDRPSFFVFSLPLPFLLIDRREFRNGPTFFQTIWSSIARQTDKYTSTSSRYVVGMVDRKSYAPLPRIPHGRHCSSRIPVYIRRCIDTNDPPFFAETKCTSQWWKLVENSCR